MTYVDGYVLAVKTNRKNDYLKMAKEVAPVFKDHGALTIVECWGDDVPDGKVTSFPMAVKLEEDETVVFSWITWPSKAVRDKGLKSAMDDPRMKPPEDMAFDGKRMIFGGFETILNL
ncbi:MAG: DUF1428 domain-containing protein [Hyphococcus sp.]|nr:MAG: DUF1428 domain-containing protein [Marinicaulis sp.]